jgi:hypothetical protein
MLDVMLDASLSSSAALAQHLPVPLDFFLSAKISFAIPQKFETHIIINIIIIA